MDSFGLRQEQSELLKSVNELKHRLEIGESRIKELHEEEMRYLSEIPVYKRQVDDAKLQAKEFSSKIVPINKELDELNKELIIIRGLNAIESKSLTEMKEIQKKIIEETRLMNEQIKQRHEQLKQRELSVSDREKACELREVGISNGHIELDKREFDISKNESELESRNKSLADKLETHKNNVELHNRKVDSLVQAKELHAQDEQLLANKSSKLDKLIRDNIELKSALLIQSDKLSKEITITQSKQVSLDRSLADLVNQENVLKIKELRITKLAHDNGLQKELKELQESLK